MKSKFMVVLAAATLLASAGCTAGARTPSDDPVVASAPEFPAGSTMEKLAHSGHVRIGVKHDQPLFGLVGLDGTLSGFDIQIAKMIAAGLGIDKSGIEWVEAVSANREPFIQQGKVDFVVASYSITDERRKVVSFAGPYYSSGEDIMVTKGNPLGIKGPDDLTGHKTCTVSGTTYEKNLREKYSGTELVLFDTASKCSNALATGQVDAMSMGTAVLAAEALNTPDKFEVLGKPFTEDPYGIGFAKGDVQLCGFVNDTLTKAFDDGSWQAAFEKTVGQAGVPTPPHPTLDPCQS